MSKIADWQRKRIFSLAGQRGLDAEMLHAHLFATMKKKSIRDLTYQEANKFIDNLKGTADEQSSKMSYAQRKYMEGLVRSLGWTKESGEIDMDRLMGFIESRFKISRIEWVPRKTASEIIEALKAMNERQEGGKDG